jgi:hypothetical protein
MSAHEGKTVRVATLKKSNQRFLLDQIHGGKALLWGELIAFKGLRSLHRDGLRWVEVSSFTFETREKTPKLMMELLTQSQARRFDLVVKMVTGGAELVQLDETLKVVPEVQHAFNKMLGHYAPAGVCKHGLEVGRCALDGEQALSKEVRHQVMEHFLKVE